MNMLDRIDQLAGIACGEQVPVNDVSDRVLGRISTAWRYRGSIKPLAVFTAVSGIAAAILLFIALQFGGSEPDPTWTMIKPLQEIPLW